MVDVSWEVTYFYSKNMGGNDEEIVPQVCPAMSAICASGIEIDFIFWTRNGNLPLVLFEN